jgi:hypothetical protein
MLERVVHMIAGVITAGIVTHPGLAVIDVGHVRVAGLIAVTAVRLNWLRIAPDGCRAARRWSWGPVFRTLRKRGRCHCKEDS